MFSRSPFCPSLLHERLLLLEMYKYFSLCCLGFRGWARGGWELTNCRPETQNIGLLYMNSLPIRTGKVESHYGILDYQKKSFCRWQKQGQTILHFVLHLTETFREWCVICYSHFALVSSCVLECNPKQSEA